jgi:hypothetical protein
VAYVTIAVAVLLNLIWFVFGVRKTFAGPPIGKRIVERQSHMKEIESEFEEPAAP